MIGGDGAARLEDAWAASTTAARHAPADDDVLGERPFLADGWMSSSGRYQSTIHSNHPKCRISTASYL